MFKSAVNFVFDSTDSILQEYPVIDVNPDHIIDTCGAGDAFVGGKFGIRKPKTRFHP